MPRKQHKYHYIYKTTNTLNNKYYIGMHSTDNLDDGYVGSGKKLWYSIKKYGKENHKCEILEFFPDRKALKKKEAEIVNEKLLQDAMCMNLALGGTGGWEHANNPNNHNPAHTLEHMKMMSKRGLKARQEKLEYLRQNNPKWKKNLYIKMSEGQKQTYKNGRVASFKGMQHTEKTKAKMRRCRAGKQTGEKNSQYGSCWIYSPKDKINKKIKKDEINKYINNGWVKGRKMFFY